MKVAELVSKTHDHIVLYKAVDEDYIDVFVGSKKDIPYNLLQMEVAIFGSKRKGVLDIQIRTVEIGGRAEWKRL